jgi:ribosome maturation factor RimP
MDLTNSLETRRALRDLMEPTVERLGYWLSAIEVTQDARGTPVVCLFLDAEGGVGIADCAKVSRALSPLLDASDPITGTYNLEVSSPGFDRLLERYEDFVRFAGFPVKVQTAAAQVTSSGARRRYAGTLQGVEDGAVVVLVDGQLYRLPLGEIARARLAPTPDDYDRLRVAALGAASTGVREE